MKHRVEWRSRRVLFVFVVSQLITHTDRPTKPLRASRTPLWSADKIASMDTRLLPHPEATRRRRWNEAREAERRKEGTEEKREVRSSADVLPDRRLAEIIKHSPA